MPTQMPKKGRPVFLDRLRQRFLHALHDGEAAAAIGIGADARQHDAIGRGHPFRPVGEIDFGRDARLAGGALEGLRSRAQIARPVVNDGDPHQRSP